MAVMALSSEINPSQEIVKYRHQSSDRHQSSFYVTGRSASFLSRQAQNQDNSPIFRLSDDVMLLIFRHLGPIELYCARQVSSRFASTFASHNQRYAVKHPKTAGEKGPGRPGYERAQQTSEPQSSDSGCLPSAGEPLVKFNHDIIWDYQKEGIKSLIRLDVCDGCLPEAHLRPYRGNNYPHPTFCNGCKTNHRCTFFSKSQYTSPSPMCIAWEGRFRLCPHKSLSLSKPINHKRRQNGDNTTFECTACKRSLVNIADVPPRLLRTSKDKVLATWKLTVCSLKSDQVVTKDLLKRGLARLRPYNDFLCPHTTFEDSILLYAFDASRCLCFRTPTASNACAEHSPPKPDGCCLCRGDFVNLAGKFMAECEIESHHTARCAKCVATYRSTLEGNKVMLTGTRIVAEMTMFQDAGGKPEAWLTPRVYDLPMWLKSLDPRSCEGNEDTCDYNKCRRESCSRSRTKGLAWYV